MRNKGIWRKGLGVGECEVARTYTYLPHIYYISTTYLLQICYKSATNLPHICCISAAYLPQIYYTKYTKTHMHTKTYICLCTFANLSFLSSMHKPCPTYTYTFVALYILSLFLYTYLQVVPDCFFLI